LRTLRSWDFTYFSDQAARPNILVEAGFQNLWKESYNIHKFTQANRLQFSCAGDKQA